MKDYSRELDLVGAGHNSVTSSKTGVSGASGGVSAAVLERCLHLRSLDGGPS